MAMRAQMILLFPARASARHRAHQHYLIHGQGVVVAVEMAWRHIPKYLKATLGYRE
jgi:hypothetical protein